LDIYQEIIEKAKDLGASLAGFAGIDALEASPSCRALGWKSLLENTRSILVLALVHPQDKPELDWWGVKGGTSGNQKMQEFSESLSNWIKRSHGIGSEVLGYAVDPGGTFLKDAAALAGLGVIGRNNLLITPEYGPGLRLRAIALDAEPAGAGKGLFSPCDGCSTPCWEACPQDAFADGHYNRAACSLQMKEDESNKQRVGNAGGETVEIRYCRACELACPVGR
jgi:epoxyqueuosine reductase